jgi:hypothetical protein
MVAATSAAREAMEQSRSNLRPGNVRRKKRKLMKHRLKARNRRTAVKGEHSDRRLRIGN